MKVVTTNKLNRFWKKGIKPFIDSIANKFDKANLSNNLLTNEEGFALDARQGAVLQGEIDEIYSNLSQIGTSVTANADIKIPTATGKAVTNVKLTKGKYIIFGSFFMDANSNGYRQINIHSTAGYDSTSNSIAEIKIPAPDTGYAILSTSRFVSVGASGETYYLNAFQNSGTTLNCSGRLTAVRIG